MGSYIIVDINKGVLQQPYNYKIPLKQGDRNSRELLIQLMQYEKPYVIESTQKPRVWIEKPDKTRVFIDGTVVSREEGKLKFIFTEQALAVAGDASCEIVLTDTDSLLSTPLLEADIKRSINAQSGIESRDEFNVLLTALSKVESWDKEFQLKYDTLEAKYATDLTLCKEQILDDKFTVELTQRNAMSKVGVDTTTNVHTSVQDGLLKSAIVKGNTLVNLIPSLNEFSVYGTDTSISSSENSFKLVQDNTAEHVQTNLNNLSANKAYMLVYEVLESTLTSNSFVLVNSPEPNNVIELTKNIGLNKVKFTQNEVSSSNHTFRFAISTKETTNGNYIRVKNPMLFEYQDGMENWDIPYFTGMASVVNPSVTSVGKTLLSTPKEKEYGVGATLEFFQVVDCASVFDTFGVGETYFFSLDIRANKTGNAKIYFQNGLGARHYFQYDVPVTTNYVRQSFRANVSLNNANQKQSFLAIYTTYDSGCFATIKNLIISKVESDELYKSNSVLANEEITLRSLPNGVSDTLNMLTGEYIQRIEEVTLSGVEFYTKTTTDGRDHFYTTDYKTRGKAGHSLHLLCDKYPVSLKSWSLSDSGTITTSSATAFQIGFTFTEGLYTLETFKQLLIASPVKVQYELNTPIVKKVDLSGLPFSYKNGHILLSSKAGSLLPIFTYSASANQSSQITQNNKAIIEHDKQINSLELLVIPSLLSLMATQVAMMPQALTLDETESSNDLSIISSQCYNMISRLIDLNYSGDIHSEIEKFNLLGVLTDSQSEELNIQLDPNNYSADMPIEGEKEEI